MGKLRKVKKFVKENKPEGSYRGVSLYLGKCYYSSTKSYRNLVESIWGKWKF